MVTVCFTNLLLVLLSILSFFSWVNDNSNISSHIGPQGDPGEALLLKGYLTKVSLVSAIGYLHDAIISDDIFSRLQPKICGDLAP